jgi:hypothetical protein
VSRTTPLSSVLWLAASSLSSEEAQLLLTKGVFKAGDEEKDLETDIQDLGGENTLSLSLRM